MALEIVVGTLAVLGYVFGSYADEQRSRAHPRRLRPLREQTRGP